MMVYGQVNAAAIRLPLEKPCLSRALMMRWEGKLVVSPESYLRQHDGGVYTLIGVSQNARLVSSHA